MANVRPLQCLNLDTIQQKYFMKFFRTLPDKPATTIRFFDRSDYYSCHGPDADFVAKCVFKSTTVVKIMAPAGSDFELPYVVLSKSNFESFVRDLLLVRNYRVEIYILKGCSTKTSNEWVLEFKGSPGNLAQFEDILYANNDMVAGSALIALHVKQQAKQKVIGISCVDTHERQFLVSEIIDNDFYSELEALIVILSPKECILPTADSQYERIINLLKRNNVVVTTKKKQDFSLEKNDVIQDLNKLLRFSKGQQESANTIPETSKTIALAALGVAIRYLDLVNDSSNHGQYQMKLLNLKRFVHLDAAAVTALNLFPKPGFNMNSPAFRWHCLLGVLDRCRTPQGHRLMAQWIKQPLRNYEMIKDRHDIVECLVDNAQTRSELHDLHLKRLPDILLVIRKLLRKKASLQDIFRLYQVVLRVPKIFQLLEMLENTAIRSVISNPMKDALGDLKLFKAMVEQILDLEAIERGEYLVTHTFNNELKELKKQMDEIVGKMKRLLSKIAGELGLEEGNSIKLDFVGHIGYHFRISLKDETLIRKNSKFQILDAIKGGVRFSNETLTDYNTDFTATKESYQEQQKSIVDEVVRIAIGYVEPWTILNNQIAQLDCFLSFAVAATSAPEPYIRPRLHPEGEGFMKLVRLRHPCIELQEDVNYIANDADFQKDKTMMYIITGPNMGGKSTFIRSVGVAVLMAHVGAFVPCAEADITIVDSILGRIGANDNLSKGLSTFMVEMVETAGVIRTATERSLVIIDELGRGTSTYEGCGIAWSIAEYLAKEKKCFTLFATHFHEITEIADTIKSVYSCHMEAIADKENFTLLYQVQPGVMQKSFGIQVAILANFPKDVVELAQNLYDECEDHYNRLQANNDREGVKVFLDSIDKISNVNPNSDEAVKKMLQDVHTNVRNCNSPYFRNFFPHLYT
ncbi:DNA mismatch repair protein spellchecker 1 [Malaya genurostris]|uniref:DNA mismatch repair protein spellchecker 1 n=1 Tax=Malaya genurostris TaxID=325434 RepID=UPI0026F38959|nr:DNA mismatch repair protein spellchecker 1 [Malaya genurostris]XP_058455641.1 DNA mismatch repair protein spellchecker 1 [Malaya genurostris]